MHIPDGYIPISQATIYWIIAGIFILRSVKWAKKDMNENLIPLFGVLAAGMFVLQTINIAANLLIPIPISGGVSWHIVGATLAAIIFGSPYASVLLMTLVLGIQALFGDGGITAMGANITNMGIIGGFFGYYTYIGLRKILLARPIALFTGAWISMVIPAIALAFELWLAGTFPLKEGVLFMAIFQSIAGIGEGAITVIVFNSIIKIRPDIVEENAHIKVSIAKVAAAGVLLFLGLAVISPFMTSSDPDGLGKTAEKVITKEIDTASSLLFSSYEIPGLGKSGEILAVVIGFIVVLLISYGGIKVLKKE